MAQPSRTIQEIYAQYKEEIWHAVSELTMVLMGVQGEVGERLILYNNPQGCRELLDAETAAQAARDRFIQACLTAGITNWQETEEGQEVNRLLRLEDREEGYLQQARQYIRDAASSQSLPRSPQPDLPDVTPFQPRARRRLTASENVTRNQSHRGGRRERGTSRPAAGSSAPSRSVSTQGVRAATLFAVPEDENYNELISRVRNDDSYRVDQHGRIYQLSRSE